MPRIFTIRLQDRKPKNPFAVEVPRPKILVNCQLSETDVAKFPDSILGSALLQEQNAEDSDVYSIAAKGAPGGCTLTFYGRDEALFTVAMDVYKFGGLHGVDLAPEGFTLEDVAQELSGFWQLPFAEEDVRNEFVAYTAHHLKLLSRYAAESIWQQMQGLLYPALQVGYSRAELLSQGFAMFAVEHTRANEPSKKLAMQVVRQVKNTFISQQLGKDWDLCTELERLTIDWDAAIEFNQDIICSKAVADPSWFEFGWDQQGEFETAHIANHRSITWQGLQELVKHNGDFKLCAVSVRLTRSELTAAETLDVYGRGKNDDDGYAMDGHDDDDDDDDDETRRERQRERDEKIAEILKPRIMHLVLLSWD